MLFDRDWDVGMDKEVEVKPERQCQENNKYGMRQWWMGLMIPSGGCGIF